MEIVIRVTPSSGQGYHLIDEVDYEELARLAKRAVDGLEIGESGGKTWHLTAESATIRPGSRHGGREIHLAVGHGRVREGACGLAGSAELTSTLAHVTCGRCLGTAAAEIAYKALYGKSD